MFERSDPVASGVTNDVKCIVRLSRITSIFIQRETVSHMTFYTTAYFGHGNTAQVALGRYGVATASATYAIKPRLMQEQISAVPGEDPHSATPTRQIDI